MYINIDIESEVVSERTERNFEIDTTGRVMDGMVGWLDDGWVDQLPRTRPWCRVRRALGKRTNHLLRKLEKERGWRKCGDVMHGEESESKREDAERRGGQRTLTRNALLPIPGQEGTRQALVVWLPAEGRIRILDDHGDTFRAKCTYLCYKCLSFSPCHVDTCVHEWSVHGVATTK